MSSSRSGPNDSSRSGGRSGTGRSELDYLRKGRSQALDRFSKEYAGRILGWAIRLGPPSLEPQNIARDVFAEVLSQLDNQPEKLPAKVWIYRLTRTVILRHTARNKNSGARWIPWRKAPKATGASQGKDDENPRRRAVQEVLQCLTLKEREVLVLVDMEDFSLAETSMLVGVQVAEVGILLQKAREKFAQVATKKGVDAPGRSSSPKRKRR